MNNTTPDYVSWPQPDLINETTRLALEAARRLEHGQVAAHHDRMERFHLAQAALITVATSGKNATVVKRGMDTCRDHLEKAARHRAARLGLAEGVPA